MNLDTLFFPSRVEKENRLILLDKKEIKSTGIFGVEFNNVGNFDQYKVMFDGLSVNTSANTNILMNLNNDYVNYVGYYMRGTSATVSASAIATSSIIVGLAENSYVCSGEVTISNQKDVWKSVISIFGKADLVQTTHANWKNLTDRLNKISINQSSIYPFKIGAVFRLYGLR